MMKRRVTALLCCLILMIPLFAAAETSEYRLPLPELGVECYLEKVKDWTVVTADNLEENMALFTARGETEENVRMRYKEGHVAFEAFRKELPNGRFRLEVFEDADTRSIWNLDDLTKKQYIAVAEGLEETLFKGRYQLFKIRYQASDTRDRCFYGSLIAYPPYQYESGRFLLRYLDGKAFLASYTQTTEASANKHIAGDDTLHRLEWTALNDDNGVRLFDKAKTPVADLRHDDERYIVNAHSGDFVFTGGSEKGASVTVAAGGVEREAKVDKDGKYSCHITLLPGDNEVVSTAEKKGLERNTLVRVIAVDDGMAALEMTKYPLGNVDRDEIEVEGVVSSGATVTIQIDEESPVEVKADKDGEFEYEIAAADWQTHVLTVTAREEGLRDCVAQFEFSPEYEDAKKGISAFRKTLTEGVTGKKLVADPGAYIGARVKLEVYITDVSRDGGFLTLTCRIDSKKDQPIYLVCDSYLEDEILDKMLITVYGTVIEPSLTDTPVPRLEIEYVSYLKTIYRKWPYR